MRMLKYYLSELWGSKISLLWIVGAFLCWASYLGDGKVRPSPLLLVTAVAAVLAVRVAFRCQAKPECRLETGKALHARGKFVKARRYLEKAAEHSSEWEADKLLGDLYFYGRGVEKDWGKALLHYQAVLSRGCAIYHTRSLGPEYSRHMNAAHAEAVEDALPQVVANIEEITKAGGLGADELVLLGNKYYTGFLGRRWLDKAMECYGRADALGDARAFRFIRMAIVENEESSAAEVEEALADLGGRYAAGDDNAGVELAKYHAKGSRHLPADWEKARSYFTPLLKKIGDAYDDSALDTGLMHIAGDIAEVYEELGRAGELTVRQREMLEKIDDEPSWL